MKIFSTKDIHEGPLKIVIYGQSGVGKTYLSRTLPHKEVFVISAESGLKSLSDTDIAYADIGTDDNGAALVGQKKVDRLKEILAFLKKEEQRKIFKTIIVDSITEISEVALAVAKLKFPNKAQSFDLWSGYGDAMIEFIKELRDMPHYNVVILALEDLDKDDANRFFYGPALPGRTPREFLLPAYDVVMRFVKDKDGRYLVTSSDGMVKAKDRTGKLSEKERPDLTYLFEKLRGKKEGQNEKEKSQEDKNQKQ